MGNEHDTSQSSQQNDYLREAQHALVGFQIAEAALKSYITFCYEVIAASMRGRLPFDYKEGDVDELPLGRLLTVFAKYNHNAALIERLRKLQKDRNHIAHQAFLLAFVGKEPVEDTLGSEFEKVREIANAIWACIPDITKEVQKAQLMRDQLPEEPKDK